MRLLVLDEDSVAITDGSVVACLAPAESEPEGATLKPGDVNGDGNFNILDAVAHLGFLFGSGNLADCFVVPNSQPVELTETGLAILDFNGDGVSNISDAVEPRGSAYDRET